MLAKSHSNCYTDSKVQSICTAILVSLRGGGATVTFAVLHSTHVLHEYNCGVTNVTGSVFQLVQYRLSSSQQALPKAWLAVIVSDVRTAQAAITKSIFTTQKAGKINETKDATHAEGI